MTRWQPTRAGIVNVWRYYDEVFGFEHGRLLLRGPNGSGKSKALELLLPYLLDASTQPSRLSTFGNTSRTMHWNLMGEGATGTTRVGFVWLEFATAPEAQTDDQSSAPLDPTTERPGPARFTIAARLQASVNSTSVTVTYFTTSATIGEDLHLTDDQGAPITTAALREALGDRGTVHPDAGSYRTAVRETLYPAMTADRYRTLVQALLQLRRPKLSEHLDPDALSGLLSSALPPVDELQIAELAEGFERLDQQRAHLAKLDREAQAARELVAAVRRYADAQIGAHATALIKTTSQVTSASSDVRDGEQTVTTHQQTVDRARQVAEQAQSQHAQFTEARSALERSDAYAEGRNLDDFRRLTATARTTADRAAADAERAQARAAQSQTEVERQLTMLEQQLPRLGDDIARVATTSTESRVIDPGDGALQPPAPLDASSPNVDDAWLAGLHRALADVDARSRSRHGEIDHLLTLVDLATAAVAERRRAELEADEADEQLATARAQLDDAVATQSAALKAHSDAVLAWHDRLEVLVIDRTQLTMAIDEHRDSVLGVGTARRKVSPADPLLEPSAPTVVDLVATSRDRVVAAVDLRRGQLDSQRAGVAAKVSSLAEQQQLLQQSSSLDPLRAGWRTGDLPDVGAPLWRLIDSQPDAAPTRLAMIEAALESSGLLDAWVFPDGQVHLDTSDVVLSSTGAEAPRSSLADALRPDTDQTSVDRSLVDSLLRSIALDDDDPAHANHVFSDGRWRLGVLHGRHEKPAAQFIGASARERHRIDQLAQVTRLREKYEAQLLAIDDEVLKLSERRVQAVDEANATPVTTHLQAASEAVVRAENTVQERQSRLAMSLTRRSDAEHAADARHHEAETAASQASLPTDPVELIRLRGTLVGLRQQTEALRHDLGTHVDRVTTLAQAVARARHDDDETRAQQEHATQAEAEALAQQAALHELDATRGAEYREVRARIEQLDRDISAQLARRRQASHEQSEAEKQVAKYTERVANAALRHAEAMTLRDAAQAEFTWLLGTLLAQAAGRHVEQPERVRPTLDLARQLVQELPLQSPSVATLNTAMIDKIRESSRELADRAQIETNVEHEVSIPSALHGGRRTSVSVLSDAVATERERTRTEITQGELELFRGILTGDTRRHLSSRIRDAGELIAQMNRRLADVRTASQVQVRLVWEVRKDEGDLLARARDLLLTTPDRLTDDDERALAGFLEQRIARARESNTGLPWAQQLATVFDYTSWHRFRVQMRRGETAQWNELTKQRHSALSGGEKAIALHLPLFAALAAHYEATPGAPRLILLDEVFVGIDTANRGQIFGLLADLELDLFLTSDHEWATYPEVDGIAIHALASDDNDDAVTSTRFVWTGTEVIEDPADEGRLV